MLTFLANLGEYMTRPSPSLGHKVAIKEKQPYADQDRRTVGQSFDQELGIA